MDHQNYDVVVVGGGPAGLSAAFAAARSGAKVALYEKSKEIGYPVHTSGGSWIEELKRLGVPARFMHPITEGHFFSPNRSAVFTYDAPVSCVLDIRGLYQFLAQQAALEGAQIYVKSTVTEPLYDRQSNLRGLRVRRFGREEEIVARLLIDASGATALLARKIGLTGGFERIGIGAELDLVAPKWPQNRVAFMFGTRVAPSGYAWIFPHGDHRIRLGIGLISPDTHGDPKEHLQKLLGSDLFRDTLSGASQIEYHSGVIPSDAYLARTVADGLLVVGDAGGLISTLLGEGIRFAIDIGRMAGYIAGEAVGAQRFDARFLQKFEKEWQKKYGRLFRIGHYVNRRLASYTDADWDRRVEELAKLDPDSVPILLKGDLRPKTLLRIMRNSPTFFTKAVAARLRSIF